jgi:hypothetical protein
MQSDCSSQNTTTSAAAGKAGADNSSASTNTHNSTTTTTITAAPSGTSVGTSGVSPTASTAGSINAPSINQTAFQVRMHIEDACMAIRNNDSTGALKDLDLAIKSIDNSILTKQTSTTPARAGAGR